MARPIPINHADVLLAIDLQADFMPGGALAVEGGDQIVPLVNRLASRFDNVELSFLIVPMLLSGVLFDVAFTLLRRALTGERLTEPHRGHLYQTYLH